MKYFKITFIALLLILLTILVVQNGEPVETQLIFWTVSLPQAAFLMSSAVVGFLIGVVAALINARTQIQGETQAREATESPDEKSP